MGLVSRGLRKGLCEWLSDGWGGEEVMRIGCGIMKVNCW